MKQFQAPLRNGKLRTRGLWAARRCGFLRAIAINFSRIYRHLQRTSSPPRQTAAAPSFALLLLLTLRGWLGASSSAIVAGSAYPRLPATMRA